MALTVVDHPLVADRVARLRATTTASAEFRRLTAELSTFLAYEATRDLETNAATVTTPLGLEAPARVLPRRAPLLVPILRAGLGLLDGVLAAIPSAEVGLVGLARDEETHQPTPYCIRFPADIVGVHAMVLDPMLATGGSLVWTLELLRERGAERLTAICLLASPEGIGHVAERVPEAHVVVAAVDDGLDEQAFIVPGLGDAGDRLYGRV